MRRLLTWLGLTAGALVLLGRFRRRRRHVEAAAVDHAEALKRTLAESRAEEPGPDAEPEPEQEPAPSLEERRRAVHDRARTAIDDMLGGDDLPGEETH
jgi:hypothetical protein